MRLVALAVSGFVLLLLALGLCGIVLVVVFAGEPPPQPLFAEDVLKMWSVNGDLNVVLICPEDHTVVAEFIISKETIAAYNTKRGVDSTEMAMAELKKAVLEYRARKDKP